MLLSISSSSIRKVALFVGTIISMVYVMDSLSYIGLSKMFKSVYSGQTGGKVNRVLFGLPNRDILIMGSSKASHHVNTVKFINAYNLGHDGGRIGMSYSILELLIKYGKPPKIIILHTDPGEYFKSYETIDSNAKILGIMSGYYHESPFVRSIVGENIGRGLAYELFKSYTYNGKVFSIVKNFLVSEVDPKNWTVA